MSLDRLRARVAENEERLKELEAPNWAELFAEFHVNDSRQREALKSLGSVSAARLACEGLWPDRKFMSDEADRRRRFELEKIRRQHGLSTAPVECTREPGSMTFPVMSNADAKHAYGKATKRR